MVLPKTGGGFNATAYLAWEEAQPERNEYIAGEVFAMVGVRQSHNVASGNIYNALRRELTGSPCRVFIESVKTRIEAADCFFYPDVVVTRDPRDRQTPAYVSHPLLLVEALSEYGPGDSLELASQSLKLDVGELLDDTLDEAPDDSREDRRLALDRTSMNP